jgi:hypothetical protein
MIKIEKLFGDTYMLQFSLAEEVHGHEVAEAERIETFISGISS